MEIEIWKDIPDYVGLYQASTWGRVKSLGRLTPQKHLIKESFLNLILNNRGYLTVNLCRDGKQITKGVHSLVLEVFVGPRPKGYECCHYDGCRTNNHLENLRWDTHLNNMLDTVRHGTAPWMHNTWSKGEDNSQAKLTEDNVLDIRKYLAEGFLTQKEIGDKFGVHRTRINHIKTGRSWLHIPSSKEEISK